MLGVVHRASWSGWGIRPNVRGDAPHRAGKTTAGGPVIVARRGRAEHEGGAGRVRRSPPIRARTSVGRSEVHSPASRVDRPRELDADATQDWGVQPFVQFGDNATAHAALKLLRGSRPRPHLFPPQRVGSPIRRAPPRRDNAGRSAGAVSGRTLSSWRDHRRRGYGPRSRFGVSWSEYGHTEERRRRRESESCSACWRVDHLSQSV
jgi:hypothetical protein